MDKKLMIITGENERLKELSSKLENELLKAQNVEDIDFETIADIAEECGDCADNLFNVCSDA